MSMLPKNLVPALLRLLSESRNSLVAAPVDEMMDKATLPSLFLRFWLPGQGLGMLHAQIQPSGCSLWSHLSGGINEKQGVSGLHSKFMS